MAVSHLHRDHYCGLLEPLPNVREHVELVLARFPRIDDAPAVGPEFLARLMAYSSLDPSHGPLDIDLVTRLRRIYPGLRLRLVSRGARFNAADTQWKVLWPKASVSLGQRGLTDVKNAIKAYDEAAEKDERLRERLDQIRDNELFEKLVESIVEPRAEEESPTDETRPDESGLPDEMEKDGGKLLTRAGTLLGKAANHLSLVAVSREHILLTGDASRQAMKQALKNDCYECSVVVTPHHGGAGHVPDAVENSTLISDVWVSSTGGSLSSKVWDGYDKLSGRHFRTDYGGNVDLLAIPGRAWRVDVDFIQMCRIRWLFLRLADPFDW